MSKSTVSSEPNQSPVFLIQNKDDFKSELNQRIIIGDELYERNLNFPNDLAVLEEQYNSWHDYNAEYLKQSFNIPMSDYSRRYVSAGYNSFIGQLGVVVGDERQTLKNLIKYKLTALKNLHAKVNLLKVDPSLQMPPTLNPNQSQKNKTQVFIVHGHDDLAKTQVARFIERLELKAIILHEQTSSGRTIIEKIEAYSDVGFGIVLYTPCDVGNKKELASTLNPRARQNVVFEHGFLIGKIGRSNVCALVKDNVETPKDISGVVYIEMDDHNAWDIRVGRELRSSGYDIDLNKL